MKTSLLFSVAAGLVLAGCGDNNSTKSAQSTNAPTKYDTGNPVTAVPDYIGAVGQAQKYAEKQIDLAYVNEAIQQFNAGEGRYPTNLQEMIPTYLGKMPQAPYGYKIIYDANSGTIKVVKQ
ncbi:MAG TPA: hypothetical protein VGM58_02660 [Verrucomicrobiae bacterium]|jgi:hypothetical protein